jgi:ABC-2 type transport system ATP-binding protein
VSADFAIEAHGLCRSFGGVSAVEDLDLAVRQGDVLGLLGPNGAGKTTTIRMLTTLLEPSAGTARVCGYDVSRRPNEVRRRIGYVMQEVPMSTYLLTGRERAELEAALYHVPRRLCRTRAEEVLELVGLMSHADKITKHYSGGMRKRLDLACGLLHRPEVLILDEPSLGLDVQARHRVWDYIKGLSDEGTTILLATNYLDEADRLCNQLVIIDGGRAVVDGSSLELKRAVAADVIQVTTASADELRRAISSEPWITRLVLSDSGDLHIYVDDATVALPAVMNAALELGILLERVTYTQPTLDDVFLLHTGRELRELEASG